ncbi:hypothetical protein ACSMXM_05540 [Pacificimonas sp. ICDLI1SI03]
MAGKVGRPKGIPKTGGRKKGQLNRVTVEVKNALEDAFDGVGGVPALIAWGKEKPDQFFPLWAKLMPVQINAEHTGKDGGAIQTEEVSARADEFTRTIARLAAAAAKDSGS